MTINTLNKTINVVNRTVNMVTKTLNKQPPLTAFKTQKNIRDYIIRAKVPPQIGPCTKKRINGQFKCGKYCVIFPFIKKENIKNRQIYIDINSPLKFNTQNIVYMIQQTKERCKQQYI